jgi:hypothetical protein
MNEGMYVHMYMYYECIMDLACFLMHVVHGGKQAPRRTSGAMATKRVKRAGRGFEALDSDAVCRE